MIKPGGFCNLFLNTAAFAPIKLVSIQQVAALRQAQDAA